MQLDLKHFDTVYKNFHDSWDVNRIRNMSIADYADLSNHDSLCYWLEYGTKQLGAIGRVSLQKFELWKPKNNKEFKDGRYKKEDGYAWNSRKGETLTEAFLHIRNLIINIVENSMAGNFHAIENIDFHAIGKWKLAFLFSDKKLLPVYSKRALLAIATGLGHQFSYNDNVYDMQVEILSHKPQDEDVVEFSYRIYKQFADRNKPDTNYYIIGSKYEQSVIEDFIKNKCIGLGWIWDADFSSYMGGTAAEVSQFVEDNYKDTEPPISKIKGYFRLFSQLKEGDIVAVKSKGSFSQLTIIAYAQVVRRNDTVYFYDEDELAHCIHVEFLDAGFEKFIGENYASTIHQLTPEKDGTTFYNIFGWYVTSTDEDEQENDKIIDTPPEENEDRNEDAEIEGYNEKIVDNFERSASAKVIVRRIHNRIQNRFIKYLQVTYPLDTVAGEKGYVDARRSNDHDIYMYEIKPFTSVYTCIREAIGQLLDYHFQSKTKKNKKLIVVGPNHPDQEDLQFLEQIQTIISIPLNYIAFNEATLIAVEY